MERSEGFEKNVICGRVTDSGGTKGPIRNAEVTLSASPTLGAKNPTYAFHSKVLTDEDGRFRFTHLDPNATYKVETSVFGQPAVSVSGVTITPGCETGANLAVALNVEITTHTCPDDGSAAQPCSIGRVGRRVLVRLECADNVKPNVAKFDVNAGRGTSVIDLPDHEAQVSFTRAGTVSIEGVITDR